MSKELRTRLLYLLAIVVTFLLYFILNRSLTPKFMFETYVDGLIPFTPLFGVAYSSYLVFLTLWIGYTFLNFPLARYQRFSAAFLLVQFLAYVSYVILPTKILRPHVGNGLFESVVQAIYYVDNPTNLTPSLHVANSVLIALFMLRVRTLRLLISVWAALIVISTMAVKQHYFVDVVTGIFLAGSVYLMVERYMGETIGGENVSR